MYCSSVEPFPETGELANSTFHSAVLLSEPMHVFSAPRNLSYVTVSDAGIKRSFSSGCYEPWWQRCLFSRPFQFTSVVIAMLT